MRGIRIPLFCILPPSFPLYTALIFCFGLKWSREFLRHNEYVVSLRCVVETLGVYNIIVCGGRSDETASDDGGQHYDHLCCYEKMTDLGKCSV